MNEKVMKLFEDRSFLEKILKMDDETSIVEAFKQEGVDLTPEDMKTLKETVAKFSERLEGISEADLENVSAGLLGSLGTAVSVLFTVVGVGSSVKTVSNNSKKIEVGKSELEKSKIAADEAEKNSNKAVAVGAAVAALAGTMCYFKKDIGKAWKSVKNKFTK